MAKFCGKVGYGVQSETSPGVWTPTITEVTYRGDVEKIATKWNQGSNLNDDLIVRNTISIVADGFAYQNFSAIKYVEWMGVKWKVTEIEVQRPRIKLSIGGEWNGN